MGDARVGGLHFCQRQVGQVAGFGFRQRHQAAGDVVCFAERQVQPAHQPVGEVGGGGETRGGGELQRVALRGHVGDHAGHRGERQHHCVGGVENLLFILLHVFGIGQRQALHHGEQRHRGPQDPADFGAQQFGGVGVFLLRHDRGAGGPAVGQLHETELGGGPDHQFLGETRQVGGADRGGRQKFEREVAVGHAVKAVGGGAVEAQGARGHLAVNREAGAGQRRRTKRGFVQAFAGIGKSAAVAGEHLDIGQHVVAPGHRLGHLQMGEAGHHPIGAGLGLGQEGLHQGGQAKDRRIALVAHPKAEVGGYLVIARTRGVQALAGFADQVGQAGFDVEMNILQIGAEGKIPALNL